MPATIRRCRPTEHVSPGLSIPGPQPCSQNIGQTFQLSLSNPQQFKSASQTRLAGVVRVRNRRQELVLVRPRHLVRGVNRLDTISVKRQP